MDLTAATRSSVERQRQLRCVGVNPGDQNSVPADRALRSRRSIRERRRQPISGKREAGGRSPAAQSSRQSETETTHAPSFRRERSIPSVTGRCRGKDGDARSYARLLGIARTKAGWGQASRRPTAGGLAKFELRRHTTIRSWPTEPKQRMVR